MFTKVPKSGRSHLAIPGEVFHKYGVGYPYRCWLYLIIIIVIDIQCVVVIFLSIVKCQGCYASYRCLWHFSKLLISLGKKSEALEGSKTRPDGHGSKPIVLSGKSLESVVLMFT